MSVPPPAGPGSHSDQSLKHLHTLPSSGYAPPATPSSSTGLPGGPPGPTVLPAAKASATAPFPHVPLPGPHLLRPTALPQPSASLGPYPLALEEGSEDPQANLKVVWVSLNHALDFLRQMTERGVVPPPGFGLPITGFAELMSIDLWSSLLADPTDPAHATVYDTVAPWFHPPASLEDMPMCKPTAPPVEIVSPKIMWMDVAPPPPSIPDWPPENALVGEPSGTVPAPPPPKPQGLRKAKAKKAAEKWVLSKGPPPPVLSASKLGAQSFAAAAWAAPAPIAGSSGSVENLVHVARSFPNLAPSAITALLQADTAAAVSAAPTLAAVVGAKCPITPSAPAPPAKKPKATTKGPSRKQVLFVLDDPNARPNLEQMPCLLNKYLTDNRVTGLCAESVLMAYGGWSIQLTNVPSFKQLNVIRQWLGIHFLPVGSEAYLPTLKSFLKLVDIPFLCQDGSRTTSDQVEGVMRVSNLSNHFVLVGPPRVVRNSKSSDTVMAYFEVWDLQRGTCAANLNVNRIYAHVDYVLESLKDNFDILFFQELPWRTIRQMVSMTSEEGDDIVGVPKHPDWLYMVRPPTNGQNPRVMAYVHRCLAALHPSMRRDIIDHCDLFVLSLFTTCGTVNLLNIYSDDAHTAINLLARDIDQLPAFVYMGSDFNCHSEVWDPSCMSHPLVAQHLLELASDIGLEWA
ncbi:hypothetical protein AN958_09617 [Leucoagaricus sp. SymC.cos]|nr:hypothetical protein AN958_09617 [Leucoagaricus sp. SymC.cos]